LSPKTTRRLRIFCSSAWNKSNSLYKWFPTARRRNKLASDQAYDLVLLDLNLPAAGGLEVLRGIRAKKPDLPVVIVTGASMVEERVRGLDAGADDYVAKPFAFAELAARIRAYCAEGTGPHARSCRSKTSKLTA